MDMDITTPSATEIAVKSPEPDPKSTNSKQLFSFTNGALKRQRHHITPPSPAAVVYKECLKNHAAGMGGHALDGCGEFMPDRSSNPNLPTSLKCAACGCHRNFHRLEPEESPTALQLLTPPPISTTTASEYQSQSHHRHLHPPLPGRATSPYPPSPPPISSSYYPSSAHHMLLALSTGLPPPENSQQVADPVSGGGRKRFRTKFSKLQKEKMYEVAERVGWKLQKRDEEIVNELCNQINVGREVFKVWMHNNKGTFNKRRSSSAEAGNNNVFFHDGTLHPDGEEANTNTEQHNLVNHNNVNGANGRDMNMIQHQLCGNHSEGSGGHVTTNGSFSSS